MTLQFILLSFTKNNHVKLRMRDREKMKNKRKRKLSIPNACFIDQIDIYWPNVTGISNRDIISAKKIQCCRFDSEITYTKRLITENETDDEQEWK